MPTGSYTRWVCASATQCSTPRQRKSHPIKIMVFLCFETNWPACSIESNVTSGRQRKINCFSAHRICNQCNTDFETMGYYYHYYVHQEARPFLSDAEIAMARGIGSKIRCVGITFNKKDTNLLRFGSLSGKIFIKLMHQSKVITEKTFSTKRPSSEEPLMQGNLHGRLIGFVHYHFEVPQHLHRYFPNFPPMFKNTEVKEEAFGTLMRRCTEKEVKMVQRRRMLILSFHSTNGTLITFLLLF